MEQMRAMCLTFVILTSFEVSGQLRSTMRSNEEYRNEIGELERKLYYTQQTVDNGNEEHKSALLEVKRLRTELESSVSA